MATRDDLSQVIMSANLDAPLDPHTYYYRDTPPPPPGTSAALAPQINTHGDSADPPSANRSSSRSPARITPRSASSPVGRGGHALNSVRSNPVLLPSRQHGSVKDIANKFNQGAASGSGPPALKVQTTQERYKRAQAVKGGKSPVSPSGAKSDHGMAKLQKRRPGQAKSPQRSPATSFETSSSFASNATVTSAKSQPATGSSPKTSRSPAKQVPLLGARPLFGELTADGWHGNFELPGYGSLPTFHSVPRRQTDGSVALGHGRSQSHQDIASPALLSPAKQKLHHSRSRSEMDAHKPQPAPSMPNLSAQDTPALYPTPPNSGTRKMLRKDPSPTSRIPVSNRRASQDSNTNSGPNSRSTSAMSNRGNGRRLSKSPTRARQAAGKENTTPSSIPRSRYQPPPIAMPQTNQTLSAKIVAPLPKTSPPLRSSRPRQPVSSATTSASRARAAERFQSPMPKDGRRPSEQWLGKPYDAQKERSRRKIPELGKVDFAERRARIQKAISQNLEEQKSLESIKTQSRRPSKEMDDQTAAGAGSEGRNSVDERQALEMNEETAAMEGGRPGARIRGLSLNTMSIPEYPESELEPKTAGTVATNFEEDESPVLGRGLDQPAGPSYSQPQQSSEPPMLLSATTYQPPSARPKTPPAPLEVMEEADTEPVQSPSILDNVLRMRERSESSASRDGTEFAEDSPSADDSPSDIEDRWGLNHSIGVDQGSIRIMLDDEPTMAHQNEPWMKQVERNLGHVQGHVNNEAARTEDYNQSAFTQNAYTESPVDEDDGPPQDESMRDTPPKHIGTRDDTLKPAHYHHAMAFTTDSHELDKDAALARAIEQYQTTGLVGPEMLEYVQNHSVDLQRLSANGGSDALMVQNLLDSMLDVQSAVGNEQKQETEILHPAQYSMPLVTPDTPPDAARATGTAVVFNDGASYEENEDFHDKIRKADEAWERDQHGVDALLGAQDEDAPTPPPKDVGYTPRSSTGPSSATFAPNLTEGLRISTVSDIVPAVLAAGESVEGTPVNERLASPKNAPPQPGHAPPPPPSATASPVASRLPFGMPDVPQMPASYSERGSNELSPRVRKNLWGPSSSRPSVDSQRAPVPPSLPGAQSMSSFADSTRHNSMDTGADSQTRLVQTNSPGPEQKRLLKRRHIIKELLDTENTYHQDLKIIEDIYKATVGDLVTSEDRKTLFGNCDEIERFSLHFYDELRRAAAPFYLPPKQMRWANKRGSFSTMQSDTTGQTSTASSDSVDEEKDRATTIGQCFLANLQRMDQVYGAYLKNHDAANQRLAALKGTQTVKCWLDECHNNASDITTAWDLDSLLVKPTQRVSKYPMLLQQLLENTAPNHPDTDALKMAAKDSVGMLTRINEAKKRADIVDQIINRKGKDTDVRSGIAKAFGRRTEKLKERVGIAEAFQDAEFDELSHKFGGHFIRLQICMRDVQDYLHRIDKAMEQISNTAGALELYTDVSPSSLPEIESKWRRYGQAIREIGSIAFPEHRAAVHKRVVQPMITCIKLHEGPQNAINKRKRRIVDYAKCKSIEKRGEKPDRKTIEASEMYVALNDQLKIELPKLYGLTADLVQACLTCFLDIQLAWYNMWERKLKPILEASDIPASIQQIEPAFRPDYDLVKNRLLELGVCNGALLAETANFLSPTTTMLADSEQSSLKRPSTLDSSKRTLSVGSDSPQMPGLVKRHSSGYAYAHGFDGPPPLPTDGRMRSNSSLSTRGGAMQTPGSAMSTNRPWSNHNTPTSSFSASRPSTANPPAAQMAYQMTRGSADDARSLRPSSNQTYFTARPDQAADQRFSGLFSSALPPDMQDSSRPQTPQLPQNQDMPVLFVCASLFEFSIDKTRKEAGYPYLTYVQGEVFDVIAQKGELWLAKNQDDMNNSLGWIWEQHFVILSQN